MLIDHPWARLLAPSQMVEIHEVFSKFGEHKLCPESALGVGRAPAYHVSRQSGLPLLGFSCERPALRADRDGNGSIEAKELSSVMRRLGLTHNAEHVQEMLDAVDLDHNGKVSEDETRKPWHRALPSLGRAALSLNRRDEPSLVPWSSPAAHSGPRHADRVF